MNWREAIRAMKLKNKDKSETVIRYCKNCGCELTSTSKKKLCVNCNDKKWAKIKSGGGICATLVSIALVIVTKGKSKPK